MPTRVVGVHPVHELGCFIDKLPTRLPGRPARSNGVVDVGPTPVAAQQVARGERLLARRCGRIDEGQVEQVAGKFRIEFLRPFNLTVFVGEQQFVPVYHCLFIA